MFYMFFEAQEPVGKLEETPIILWLQVRITFRNNSWLVASHGGDLSFESGMHGPLSCCGRWGNNKASQP